MHTQHTHRDIHKKMCVLFQKVVSVIKKHKISRPSVLLY